MLAATHWLVQALQILAGLVEKPLGSAPRLMNWAAVPARHTRQTK